MKNNSFKKSLIAGATAVLTGVVFMGVSSAIGATPTYNPPGTTVSPTLNGINVTGELKNESGTLKLNDAVDITGTITNTSSTNSGNVRIGDSLWLSGPLANKSSTLGGKVKINDELWVSGETQLDGTLSVDGINSDNGKLILNRSNGTGVQIGDYSIGDGAGLTVYGGLTVKKVPTCNPLLGDCAQSDTIGGGIVLESGITAPKVTTSKIIADGGNSIEIEGNLDFSNTALDLGGGSTFVQAVGDNMVLTATENPGSDIELISSDDIILRGDTNVGISNSKKDLRVYGHIKTDSIGKFNRVTPSTYYSVSGNGVTEKSVSCPSGQVLVSCSGQASSGPNYSATSYVYFTNMDPYGSSCFVRAKNTYSSTKYFKPIAMCFDPDGK